MPNPSSDLIQPTDVLAATGLLSRLPVGMRHSRGAAVAWAFPVVGLILGLINAAIAALLLGLGVPAMVAAGLVIFSNVMLTGALHEDGLADSADGLWGGWDKARRLEIMKDSQIGTYGVLALILALGLRWVALSTLLAEGTYLSAIIGVAILSRVPMLVLMARLPNARGAGLSASVGQVSDQTMGVGLALGVLGAAVVLGWASLLLIVVVALISGAFAAIAMRKIGGQTGDILGASQQLAEISALITLAALSA